MSKYLRKVTNYGDSTVSSIIQDNLIEFFDWAIMDIGGFNNVSVPQTDVYGGDRHKLRLVNDPRYTSGQVWEAFRGNWVWQSGLVYSLEALFSQLLELVLMPIILITQMEE